MQHKDKPLEFNGWKSGFEMFRKAERRGRKRNKLGNKRESSELSDLRTGSGLSALLLQWGSAL